MKASTVEIIAHAVSIAAAGLIIEEIITYNRSKLKDRVVTTHGTTFNNPGNIEKRRLNANGIWSRDLFRGEVPDGGDERFTSFSTMVYGDRAIGRILKTKYNRDLKTLRQMIYDFTEEPPSQDDNYVEWVSTSAGINPDADMQDYPAEKWAAVIAAIGIYEQGQSWLALNGANVSTWATQGYSMA